MKKKKGSLLAIIILVAALPSFACMCFGAEIAPMPVTGDDATSPDETPLDTLGPLPTEPQSSPTVVPVSSTTATSPAPSSTPVHRAAATGTPTQGPSPTPTPIPDEQGPQISLLNDDPMKVHVGGHAAITAKVSDPCGVLEVSVWWKYASGSDDLFWWNVAILAEIEDGVYAVQLPPYPGGFPSAALVYYHIGASDNCGNSSTSEGGEIIIVE
jgi:hypothetical protein